MSKRLEFNRKTRAAIIARAAGRCEICAAVLKVGEGEVDHVLPCELGGQPTIANGRLICRVCHKEKTASDVKRIRESDRERDRHTGAIRPAGTIKSAPFQKSAKAERRDPNKGLPPLPPRSLYRPAQQNGDV